MSPPRRLVVMRHAKAEQVAASDHERVLAQRGVADAAEAGRWASAAGLRLDHVVVSSAARTLGTWDAFASAGGFTPEVLVDRSLYAAGTDAALEIVQHLPADARTAMLVGHNPTMAHLVHLLDDGAADPEAFAEVTAGYPTSALTVLDVPGEWSELDVAGARITAFHVGRG
jgi:phosphohistidine phosphatase